MPLCKCNCGGCMKKGGMFSLDLMHETGGYTYDELKELWGTKYYDYLLEIYVKLINNLEGCSKLVKLILNIVSIQSFKTIDSNDLRKLYSLYELKSDITIHNLNYLHQALIDNIRMEPFFVLRLSNSHNFVYSEEFTKELLKQNQSEYELYVFYMKLLGNEQYTNDYQMTSIHSNFKSTIISYFSGNNLDFIKNPLNWSDRSFKSAHVILLKDDVDSGETKVLMLTHLPNAKGVKSSKKIIETDCRLGPPGGLIDRSDSTPWDAMVREYREETNVTFPSKIELINTFIWKKKHIVFVVKTNQRIVESEIENNETFSRKLFTVKELRKIIKDSNGPQVKGKFKMRGSATESTLAILDTLEL